MDVTNQSNPYVRAHVAGCHNISVLELVILVCGMYELYELPCTCILQVALR